MHYYYISGTSRGIGKALAIELLSDSNNYVIGFSRTNTLKHPNFEFIGVDLQDLDQAKAFRFIDIIDAESITLINNSGMIGHVAHVGSIENHSIVQAFNLNAISPSILTNNFVKAYQDVKCKKSVLNVSSGAARYPIESWSTYCSSKSALDMFTSVAAYEQEKLGIDKDKWFRFMSIAPGIVDTQMQDEIREVDEQSFGDVGKFIRYKTENKLLSPEEVAQKLVRLLKSDLLFDKALLDLRELTI